MNASNRSLPDWITRVRTGQIRLPRFQRFESWGHSEIVTLLDSVLRGRPVGAALVLEIGDKQPFVSRTMAGAPDPTERCTEHLLDGQQRLTALWKALNDGYENRTYFAVLKPEAADEPLATGVSRWRRNGRHYPLWADQPTEQLQRGFVPMRLLDPRADPGEIGAWCDQATDSLQASRDVERKVVALSTAIREANLPYLSLPVDTPQDEAIDVFIRMNTSNVRLSAFDIVVAQFEAATGESLHDLEELLSSAVPAAEQYVEVPDLILRVAALREDRPPTESSFLRLDLERLALEWEEIKDGIQGAIGFLAEERVFDRDRLPTVAVIPVLAAIWSQMPQSLDPLGQARTLIRQYLWRSFFTERYDRAAATAALQDYRGLKSRLVDDVVDAEIPVLDDSIFPVATAEALERAPWPKLRNTLSRAILAVSLRGGGRDFADESLVGRDTLRMRQYHHLFPAALLKCDGKLDASDIDLAMNCALVSSYTNLSMSAKEPYAYLGERAERAPSGLDQIRQRLQSHQIPFTELNVGGYSKLVSPSERSTRIRSDYERFVRARAKMIHNVVVRLCGGHELECRGGSSPRRDIRHVGRAQPLHRIASHNEMCPQNSVVPANRNKSRAGEFRKKAQWQWHPRKFPARWEAYARSPQMW